MLMDTQQIRSVVLEDETGSLMILDQTLLPNERRFIKLKTTEEIFEAIKLLRVRGAPAIGIAAAYGAYLGVKESKSTAYGPFCQEFDAVKQRLASARPTAVNLFWALDRMQRRLEASQALTVDECKRALRDEAQTIRDEDERMCKAIGEHALSLLTPGMGLLTHCNAGGIATARYGTALAPMYLGQERGYGFRVYADETRPLLQGARLTAWELHEAGVDVTLVCDGMASLLMYNGWIDACLVGCDRIAANGDTANKIGTSTLAIVAHQYGIPVYVCGPTSTIDIACATGRDIEIELRDEAEISELWYEKRMAPEGVKAYNPAFDVTEHRYITAIITQKGIARPPFSKSIAAMMREK